VTRDERARRSYASAGGGPGADADSWQTTQASPPRPASSTTAFLTTVALVAFAANSLLCRAALEGGHADAATFTTLRLLGGVIALGPLARIRGAPPPSSTAAWGSAVALLAYAAGFAFAYVRIPAGIGALLLFAAVQLTMLGAAIVAGERPRPLEGIGLASSLGGLVLLTRPGLERPDPLGAGLMLGAGAAWGVYSLRGRQHGDAIAMNAASFARALALSLAAAAAAAHLGIARVSPTGVCLALTSGAVASGLGYAVWYKALRGLTAMRAAIVQLSVPPLAAAGAVLFLNESLSSRLPAASVLILGGIALSIAARR
jgi:drug/metabolite transporter (DMT)-like permease